MFAEVVFPLPFRKAFTYSVPDDLKDQVKAGVRAVAPFGKRTLTGFILNITSKTSVKEEIKPIKDIIDDVPIFDKNTFKFYEWISDYYICSLGEALKLAVPHGSEVESKKKIHIDKEFAAELFAKEKNKNTIKSKILNELSNRDETSISTLQKSIKKKNIYSVLTTLQKLGVITILDEVEKPKVKPKKVKYVKLAKDIAQIYVVFPELERRSPKQVKVLLELISAKGKSLPVAELLHKIEGTKSTIDSLANKNIVEVFEKEVERRYSEQYSEEHLELVLTDSQQKVVNEINEFIGKKEFKTFLLHGVTGSGKTQVYIELVKDVLSQNKTALILVPEISLTPQMTSRLFNNFGDTVTVIHSRMSAGERYDSWRRVQKGKSKVVIGARSA
ncbi:MAG: DEAD/DEAH box helicase family protein, partial [Ignavibacteriaceae bacterium]|nr:DEAD/DEAH box helicase family protein [Ignavibacteriaceae bacterium]